MNSPLSKRLREETRDAHTHAERSPFMQALLRGQLDRAAYARFVVDLHAVYSALESAMERRRRHPALALLDRPELIRVPALERDAAFFHGAAWPETAFPSPVARAYATHLAAIEQTDPVRLVAHLYTRYLGDLSGGQILRRVAAKTLGLESGEGLEFYAFPAIPEPDAFKDEYRRTLDALPIDEAASAAVVEEANAAFGWSARTADAALARDHAAR